MARRFRFGICTDQNMTWEKNVERWQWFEQLGFESAWVCDHLVQPTRPQGPYLEAWTLLAGLAARTEKIRIGVLVTSNTFRLSTRCSESRFRRLKNWSPASVRRSRW